MEIITDRKNLVITVSIDVRNKEIFHLKLIDKKGKVVESYLHLSSKTIKEFKIHDRQLGKYQLRLYAGLERRLLASYDVNRY